jgi:hypothetical protein
MLAKKSRHFGFWGRLRVASSEWRVVLSVRKVFYYFEIKNVGTKSQEINYMAESYSITAMTFEVCSKLPKEENYNIISQMKRAGLPVSNNLAEGAS